LFLVAGEWWECCRSARCEPLILSARGCRELELRGIPPEMSPETDYESETVQLERSDSVIFLSDGFSESQNSTGDLFGMEKVQEICESLREKTPEEILRKMTEAVVSQRPAATTRPDGGDFWSREESGGIAHRPK
jgi:serine phosphatase RsbU (regulator of sigma subunit)